MKKKLFILTFCILTILVLILTSCDKNSEQITSNDTSNTTSKIENKTYNIKQNNPEIIHYLKLNNNDPEWGTNYENEKYKDFVFTNLPRSYEGDDFPEYMMHKEDEAYNNPCLHISVPDTYELSGKWDGQIFIDLGKDSITDPNKKINLIFNNLKVNCSVASAINIYRAYECDNKWKERKESTKDIDLKDTGVNIIIKDNTKNIINGANVYRIKKPVYKKNSEAQKTAIKYDGAIESNITTNDNILIFKNTKY